MNDTTSYIEIDNITKWYLHKTDKLFHLGKEKQWVKAVDAISLNIERGEVLGIIGESAAESLRSADSSPVWKSRHPAMYASAVSPRRHCSKKISALSAVRCRSFSKILLTRLHRATRLR